MTNPSDEKMATADQSLNWWVPVMGQREKELICQVIDDDFPNDGNRTTAFENEVARICGTCYAVATTSGTTAITLGLMACGIGPGDEAIIPDITFIATANAVRLAGATPILVDVSLSDYTISPQAIKSAIGERTRAIVPVHVSGRASDMDAIMTIAERHNLKVVEDAAEALGSKHHGKPLGSFGEVGCFSFSANKTFTTGQGGMVVTNDANLHLQLRLLKDQGRPVRGTGGDDEHIAFGYNFKLTNLQAAMGLAQLESFAERTEHQRQLYRWYLKHLPENPRIRLIAFDLEGGECPQWVDVYVEEGRDSLDAFLSAHGVSCRRFWHPLHTQAPYRRDDADFDASLRVGKGALWLPSALTLTEDQVRRVCALIEDWLAQ